MTVSKGIMEDIIYLELAKLRPTQFYLCDLKLERARQYMQSHRDDYPPLPVKKLSEGTLLLDGHHRAYVLLEMGVKMIRCQIDEQLFNEAHLASMAACEDQKIFSLEDLSSRIISLDQYNDSWVVFHERIRKVIDEDPLVDASYFQVQKPDEKEHICRSILSELPDWFGVPEAIEDYASNVRALDFVTIRLFGFVVGFVAMKKHFEDMGEIYVMGIYRNFHRMGLGRALVKSAVNFCREFGLRFLTVKTLSAQRADKSYENTRRFYKAMGFVEFEELPELWGKENPCLVMIKPIDDI